MLRHVTIYSSLHRRPLIMGCDRELILLSGLVSAALIFSVKTFASVIFGVIFWLIAFAILQRMGKADEYARHVYLRRIKYKEVYPPRSTPFRSE